MIGRGPSERKSVGLSTKDAHRPTHPPPPHLPKDATIVVDLNHDLDDRVWGHELGHWQSPHEGSAHSLTSPEERS
jgi:hypothetical protein